MSCPACSKGAESCDAASWRHVVQVPVRLSVSQQGALSPGRVPTPSPAHLFPGVAHNDADFLKRPVSTRLRHLPRLARNPQRSLRLWVPATAATIRPSGSAVPHSAPCGVPPCQAARLSPPRRRSRQQQPSVSVQGRGGRGAGAAPAAGGCWQRRCCSPGVALGWQGSLPCGPGSRSSSCPAVCRWTWTRRCRTRGGHAATRRCPLQQLCLEMARNNFCSS